MVKNDDLSPQDAWQEDTEHNTAITADNEKDMTADLSQYLSGKEAIQ